MRRVCGLLSIWSSRPRGEGVELAGPGGLLNGLTRAALPGRARGGREGLGTWPPASMIRRAATWTTRAMAAGPRTMLTPGTGAGRRSRGTRGGAFETRTVKRHSFRRCREWTSWQLARRELGADDRRDLGRASPGGARSRGPRRKRSARSRGTVLAAGARSCPVTFIACLRGEDPRRPMAREPAGVLRNRRYRSERERDILVLEGAGPAGRARTSWQQVPSCDQEPRHQGRDPRRRRRADPGRRAANTGSLH